MALAGTRPHVLFLVLLSTTLVAASQAPPENWLLPVNPNIVRDAEALNIIQASLAAMNPQGLPTVDDYIVESNVTKWAGKPTSGKRIDMSIGALAQSLSTTINGQTVHHSLRHSGSETHQLSDGKQETVNDERAFEHLPSLPQPLLIEALNNAKDGVELLGTDPSNPDCKRVRIKVRPSYWRPSMRDTASASFDLFFANDTHLLSKVRGNRHYDGSLRHYFSYEVVFTQYSIDQGRIFPHLIEETEVGKSLNVFSIDSIRVNKGLTLSSLQ